MKKMHNTANTWLRRYCLPKTFQTYSQPLNFSYNRLCRFVLRIHHRFMYETNWSSFEAQRHYHWLLSILKCVITQKPFFSSQKNKEIGRNSLCFFQVKYFSTGPKSINSSGSLKTHYNCFLKHFATAFNGNVFVIHQVRGFYLLHFT